MTTTVVTRKRKGARQPGVKFTEEQRNAMFDFWYKHDCNFLLTSESFNYNRSSLYKLARYHDWEKRAEKIKTDVQKGLDRKIIKQQITNVALAKKCLKKEAKAYLKRDHKPTGNLSMILGLMRYIDEVEGNMPAEPDGGGVVINNVVYADSEQQRTEDEESGSVLRWACRNGSPSRFSDN